MNQCMIQKQESSEKVILQIMGKLLSFKKETMVDIIIKKQIQVGLVN